MIEPHAHAHPPGLDNQEREEAARNRQDEYGNAKRKFEAEIARMREQNKKMMEDAAAKRRAATENAAEAAKSHMDELQAGARRRESSIPVKNFVPDLGIPYSPFFSSVARC